MQIGGFTDVIGTGRNDKFYTVGQCGEPVEQAIVRIGQMVKPDQDDQDMRIVLCCAAQHFGQLTHVAIRIDSFEMQVIGNHRAQVVAHHIGVAIGGIDKIRKDDIIADRFRGDKVGNKSSLPSADLAYDSEV